MNELEHLLNTGPDRIESAADLEALKDIQGELLGRKSIIAEARRSLGSLDPEQRPIVGARLNEASQKLAGLIQAKRLVLERAAEDRLLLEDKVDVTLPVRELPHAWHHLVTQTLEEAADIFVSLGY
jgi:phenylalanyl-tRNA synthetase alpha chain